MIRSQKNYNNLHHKVQMLTLSALRLISIAHLLDFLHLLKIAQFIISVLQMELRMSKNVPLGYISILKQEFVIGLITLNASLPQKNGHLWFPLKPIQTLMLMPTKMLRNLKMLFVILQIGLS